MKAVKKVMQNIGLIIMIVLWLFPSAWVALTAFKSNQEIFTIPIRIFPSRPTFYHFGRLFFTWPFDRWLLNSLVLASSVTVMSLIVCTLAAYSLSRLNWRGRDALFLVILASMLLPMEVSIIPLYFMTIRFKLFNTLYGVASPYDSVAYRCFSFTPIFLEYTKRS